VARNTFGSSGTFFSLFAMAVAAPVVAAFEINQRFGRSDF
jgi:hypothetical protein